MSEIWRPCLFICMLYATACGQDIIPTLKVCSGQPQSILCAPPGDVRHNSRIEEIKFSKSGKQDQLVAFWDIYTNKTTVKEEFRGTWTAAKCPQGLNLTVTPKDDASVIGIYWCEISNSKIIYTYTSFTLDETCSKVKALEKEVRLLKEASPSELRGVTDDIGTFKSFALIALGVSTLVLILMIAIVIIFLIRRKRSRQTAEVSESRVMKSKDPELQEEKKRAEKKAMTVKVPEQETVSETARLLNSPTGSEPSRTSGEIPLDKPEQKPATPSLRQARSSTPTGSEYNETGSPLPADSSSDPPRNLPDEFMSSQPDAPDTAIPDSQTSTLKKITDVSDPGTNETRNEIA